MTTIDAKEIEHFAQDSAKWWDEDGPFRPLHRLNPVRMDYIRDQICAHYGRDAKSIKPLKSLKTLDIGCGGGLVCEALARMGASVTGIDADAQAIQAAKDHAGYANLEINYIAGDAADLTEQYDVVTALEVVEHVSNPQDFISLCADKVKPNGLLILSTLNRTPKSWILGIGAAEYVLGWVPRGTHTWKKFLKPSELATYSRQSGLSVHNVTGLIFNPLKNGFELSARDMDVNYLICLKKPD